MRPARAALLCLLAYVLTATLQNWVGGVTIYRAVYEPRQLELHRAILSNEKPPGGSWAKAGANGVNIRVLTVHLAERMHRMTGWPVIGCYRLIDSVSLFLVFIGLFLYLRFWFDALLALLGVLYAAFTMILTYHFFFFHPWDRIGLLMWIVTLALVRAKRVAALVPLLAVNMTIKPDMLFLPALHGLYAIDRGDWKRPLAITAGLFAVTIGVYLTLLRLLPGGFDVPGRTVFDQVVAALRKNAGELLALRSAYPPLLAFALPVVLAAVDFRAKERFALACVLFAVFNSIPYVLFTHVREVRAEMPFLLLILPAALMGLRTIMQRGGPQPPRLTAPEIGEPAPVKR